MLYQIFETQRSLMEPFADFAQAASKLYGQTNTPIAQNPMSQRVSAGYDLLYRLGKDYEKPAFGIKSVEVEGTEVAIHERIEMDKPFCELRRFKRFTDDAQALDVMKSQPSVLVLPRTGGSGVAAWTLGRKVEGDCCACMSCSFSRMARDSAPRATAVPSLSTS